MARLSQVDLDKLVPQACDAIINREKSFLDKLRERPSSEREAFLKSLSKEEIIDLTINPQIISRPSQLYPGQKHPIILWKCGRGYGKTQTAASIINWLVDNKMVPEGEPSIGIIGKTTYDVSNTMVGGTSGILALSHPMRRPKWTPTKRLIEWQNGISALTFSADKVEQLRGPNLSLIWIDELCKFQYDEELWEQANLTLRRGEHPQILVTTTPKPTDLIRELSQDPSVYVITKSSYDNFNNLAPRYITYMLDRIERSDSELASQEIYGNVLTANPQAIFRYELFNNNRHYIDISNSSFNKELMKFAATMDQIIVSVDPAISEDEESDLTGITVCGIKEVDGETHGYLFEDGTLKGDADDWANCAIDLLDKYNGAYIVVEKNQGGNMIESVIHNIRKTIEVRMVQSIKSKGDRARPVGALYKQGLIHHIAHTGEHGDDLFLELEAECARFNPTLGKKQKSPDRMDAMVIGVNELFDSFDGSDLILGFLE